jgi:geranylgeranyl diphosphate synthase type II
MTGPAAIADYVHARRADVDRALARLLPAPPACPPALASAMAYSFGAGGKRLRPVLCLASAEAVGGDPALALPAACAVELIHTYSLIHDDLPSMDDDVMRRGRPTLHVVAGEAMAILAGDALLTEAFALLAREPRTADAAIAARKLRVIDVVAEAAGARGMVGGQALDLDWALPDEDPASPRRHDASAVRTIHAMKTGALIRASAVAGAVMGGGTDRDVAAIDAAAADFGLAFQIVDDILDVEGSPDDLGKATGKDAAAGKPTFPAHYGVEGSRRMAEECLERARTTLASAGVSDARLLAIGRWIVERSN